MPKPSYTLYYSPFCPFCIKVIHYMKANGIELPLKNTTTQLSFVKELVEGGGSKQVPCLLIEDKGQKQWLYESDDIIAFLSEAFVA